MAFRHHTVTIRITERDGTAHALATDMRTGSYARSSAAACEVAARDALTALLAPPEDPSPSLAGGMSPRSSTREVLRAVA